MKHAEPSDCGWPDGCEKLAKARGLCDGHYKRQMAAGGFPAYRRECSECAQPFETKSYQVVTCKPECLKARRTRTRNELRLTRGCARCGELKPIEDYSTGGTVYCRDCFNEWRRGHLTPEDHRRRMLWHKYRLTPEAFDDLLAQQGNRCALCRSDDPGGGKRMWQVDHDHACCPGARSCGMCIRGLLCQNCNIVLGLFHDVPGRFEAAITYLKRTRQAVLFAA